MTNPNWNWRPLGELFDIGAGKTMSAAARAGADKVPFLRTSNVLWDEIDLTQVDEMSISPTELVDKSLKAGDLLVCEGGEIGRAAVWDGRVPVMSFQNHLHRLRRKQDDVDARFYVYFLQSAFTQLGIFEGAGNKTTIPNLSRNRLAALDVPHPPKPEQQSVAQALAKVREAVTIHDEATSTALELKRAVMSDLFTRGLRGEPQKETEIGLMPDSWSPRTILDLCEIWSGGTPRKSVTEYWKGDIPWVSGKLGSRHGSGQGSPGCSDQSTDGFQPGRQSSCVTRAVLRTVLTISDLCRQRTVARPNCSVGARNHDVEPERCGDLQDCLPE